MKQSGIQAQKSYKRHRILGFVIPVIGPIPATTKLR